MKNINTIIILILLFVTAGSIGYNIELLKTMKENEQKILQQEQTIKDYQVKEQSKQKQYESCLEKCNRAFPDIIIELKELNAMYLQTCKLECEENYGTVLEIVSEQEEDLSKRRDARRQSDIRQISLAMEMYYNQNGEYPSQLDMPLTIGSYLNPAPRDPLGISYSWINNTANNHVYCIYAILESGEYFTASHKGTKETTKEPIDYNCW